MSLLRGGSTVICILTTSTTIDTSYCNCTVIAFDHHAGTKGAVHATCCGKDDGAWTVVNGGDQTAQILGPDSENQCTHPTGTQDKSQTSSETAANGTVNSEKNQESQKAES